MDSSEILRITRNEHFILRNDKNHSESIPQNFFGTKFRWQPYGQVHLVRLQTDNFVLFLRQQMDKEQSVERLDFLNFHHVSLVQQTICFLLWGAAVCAPGAQPTLWNWDCLLAPSHYSGDPDVIPDHQP
jgi:hypothetical protein